MESQNLLWINYRTPYSGKNGGVVFIPNEGDAVEVFFTNEEIYCAAALRENPLAAEYQNVADKYKILMNEKGVEIAVGENSIALNEQSILLKTKESKISLAKDIVAHTNGNFELNVMDTEFKSEGKLKLAGSKIEL